MKSMKKMKLRKSKRKSRKSDIHGGSAISMLFYGSATVGERGQVVIPIKARINLGVRTGDKMLFLGAGMSHGKHKPYGLLLVKANVLNALLKMTAKKLESLRKLAK